MTKPITIGLVVPTAEDKIPAEAPVMYPDVRFLSRGVRLRALTPQGYGLTDFGGPGRMGEPDILDLGTRVCEEAGDAEGLLISCGGLRTLGVARPLEERHGIPVVSSMPAALWAALRLTGASGHVAGCGRMLAQSGAAH